MRSFSFLSLEKESLGGGGTGTTSGTVSLSSIFRDLRRTLVGVPKGEDCGFVGMKLYTLSLTSVQKSVYK